MLTETISNILGDEFCTEPHANGTVWVGVIDNRDGFLVAAKIGEAAKKLQAATLRVRINLKGVYSNLTVSQRAKPERKCSHIYTHTAPDGRLMCNDCKREVPREVQERRARLSAKIDTLMTQGFGGREVLRR